jgi:hypothetical protein
MQALLGSLVRHGRVLAGTSVQKTPVTRLIWTTSSCQNVHKGGNKPHVSGDIILSSLYTLSFQFPAILESQEEALQPYFEEIKRMEAIFSDQLNKRLSLRTDLRLYEEFQVTCPDGKVCRAKTQM